MTLREKGDMPYALKTCWFFLKSLFVSGKVYKKYLMFTWVNERQTPRSYNFYVAITVSPSAPHLGALAVSQPHFQSLPFSDVPKDNSLFILCRQFSFLWSTVARKAEQQNSSLWANPEPWAGRPMYHSRWHTGKRTGTIIFSTPSWQSLELTCLK